MTNTSQNTALRTSTKPKLLESVKQQMITTGYSPKTIEAYTKWIKEYILFNNKEHPKNLKKEALERFLTHLAIDRKVSASTQNQAMNAILYLYKKVLNIEIGWLEDVRRAKRSLRLPVVFTKKEVHDVLTNLDGISKLVASLLYGGGLRLGEALRLRIKDIDFDYKIITVREAKGKKDRKTILPTALISDLKTQLKKIKVVHDKDLKSGKGETILPAALREKYPNAGKEFGWQYLFPADKFVYAEKNKFYYRYHLHESTVQKKIKNAIIKAKITKQASSHTFRHLAREIEINRLTA